MGEQYVDLVPRSESAPYLRDGTVIAARDTSIPRPVGPMLDKLSALVKSIPKDKLGQLLDETLTAFNGAGYDLESMLDSSSKISHDASAVLATHAPWSTTVGLSWTRRPRRPTRRGDGRATWPGSPTI